MTLTDEQLKELAEFSAEFLKGKKIAYGNPKSWSVNLAHGKYLCVSTKNNCFDFFENPETAPILAHLAEEKIRQMPLEMKYRYENGRHYWTLWGEKNYGEAMDFKSKYIALWLAIREAVKG